MLLYQLSYAIKPQLKVHFAFHSVFIVYGLKGSVFLTYYVMFEVLPPS